MTRLAVTLLGILFVLQWCSAQTPPPAADGRSTAKSAPHTPPAPPPTTRTALLGQRLSEAQRWEFFTFFNLLKTRDIPDPAHPGMSVKTFDTGGAFKGAMTLWVSTKLGDETITTAALTLRRDFVDNPSTAPFARDVTKSFLELSPSADSPELARLRSEIWSGARGSANPPATAAPQGGPVRGAPDNANDGVAPSAAYLTYLGKQEKCKITRPGGYVMLQNTDKIGGIPRLFVEMRNE